MIKEIDEDRQNLKNNPSFSADVVEVCDEPFDDKDEEKLRKWFEKARFGMNVSPYKSNKNAIASLVSRWQDLDDEPRTLTQSSSWSLNIIYPRNLQQSDIKFISRLDLEDAKIIRKIVGNLYSIQCSQ